MPASIADWIEKWAAATPARIAIEFEGETISYRELDARIRKHARLLRRGLGIQPGDRIAYLGQNHPRLLYLLFACARLGAMLVPLNWRLAPPEHRHILQDSGAAALFVDAPYSGQCDPLRDELPGCRCIALEGPAKPGWLALDALLDAAGKDTADPDYGPDIGLDRPLLVLYTSGTTGLPKGAVLAQRAIEVNAVNSTAMHDLTSQDRVLTFLPMFHVGGLNVQTTPALHAGATVLLHRTFDAAQVLRAVHRDRPTLTIILPAHMPALETLADWQGADFSTLRSITTGSTAIPSTMIAAWHSRGIPLLQLYGATETCPIAIHQHTGNAFATEGSIGFPALHCDIRVADDAGRDCAAGTPGEFLIRGGNVMSQYWNKPEATRDALRDGWFHSGDMGFRNAAGAYFFLERRQDVIISGGENIYPAELENVLLAHPAVIEAAVIGRADARWGEVAVAIVVARPGSDLSLAAVLDWFQGRLGRYKHPRDVLFVDALPRNEMRKVVKQELRAWVAAAAGDDPK